MTTPTRLNRLIEMFEAGVAPVGAFAFNLTTRSAAALSTSPLDFLIVDLEHSSSSFEHLEVYLLALTDKRRILEKRNLQPDVVPLVRLPSYGWERIQYLIKQALDLGVFGIVVPCVNTAADAECAVRAMRFAHAPEAADYRPQGERGVGFPFAARYWGLPEADYGQRADLWPLDRQGELLLWCMVETQAGLSNCREIARTPGVSGILIGPSDLSFSLEGRKGGEMARRKFPEILQICRQEGVRCGLVSPAAETQLRLEEGFDFLAVGVDTGMPAPLVQATEAARQFRLLHKARRAPRQQDPTT
jgi:4-hydroxy-2-oxoheptanedioate aldolase